MKTIKKVNKKQIVTIAFITIMALLIFLAGCSASNIETGSISSAPSSVSINDNAAEAINTDTEVAELSGTCPRNNSCSYPGKCGSYIDLNVNGLCDRGE